MSNLLIEDLDELDFFKNLKIFNLFGFLKFYIAGGCFTQLFLGNKPNDIDIFFANEEELQQAIRVVKSSEDLVDKNSIYENDLVLNFYMKKQKVQLIKKYFYQSHIEIFADFDFTICKFAYDGENIHYHDRFFKDLAKKKLVIDGELIKPLGTLKRSYKYTSRGFKICPKGMAKIARSINALKIDWDNPDENIIEFYPDGTPTFLGLD